MPSQSENRTEDNIIELTDVVEEGHPDQPNLPQAASSSAGNEVLDDLDLEKEIDHIFAELGAPSADSEAFVGADKTPEDELDLDDLFGKAQTESGDETKQPAQEPEKATSLGENEDVLQELAEGGADVGGDAHPAMEMKEPLAPDELPGELSDELPGEFPNLNAPGEKPAAPMAGQGQVQSPQAALGTPREAEELSALQQRLATMEEKVAALDDLDRLIARQLDQRLEAFGREAFAAQEEQVTVLRQELETAWEQKAAEMIEAGLDKMQSRQQEAMDQALAAHKEELKALLDSRLQKFQPAADQEDQDRARQQMQEEIQTHTEEALRPIIESLRLEWTSERENLTRAAADQDGARESIQALREQWQNYQEQAEAKDKHSAEDFSATLEQLRADLLQELQAAIPGAAARIIREEIQALTEE